MDKKPTRQYIRRKEPQKKITVYVSESERTMLDKIAAALGFSRNEYVRQRIVPAINEDADMLKIK